MSTPASRHPSAPASPEEGPLGASAGTVLSFRTTDGWGNVPGNWAVSVSTQAATFEAWIRTTVKDPQTIILGSNSPGPRRGSAWAGTRSRCTGTQAGRLNFVCNVLSLVDS